MDSINSSWQWCVITHMEYWQPGKLTQVLVFRVITGVSFLGTHMADINFQPFRKLSWWYIWLKTPALIYLFSVVRISYPKSHCYYLAGARLPGKRRHYQAWHAKGLEITSQTLKATILGLACLLERESCADQTRVRVEWRWLETYSPAR